MCARLKSRVFGAIIGSILLPMIASCEVSSDPAGISADSDRQDILESDTRIDLSSPPVPSAHGAYDPHTQLSPSQHVKVALQHKSEGRLPMAIDTLTNALDRYDNDQLLLSVRSSLYLEAKQYSPALQDMNVALQKAPSNSSLLINRAKVYSQFGRLDDALTDLNNAITIDENLVAAYFNRGTIHHQKGDYKLALDDFTRCISIDPHMAGPYFNRAATLDLLGNNGAAIADIQNFIELTDNEVWKQKAEELLSLWQHASESESNGTDG